MDMQDRLTNGNIRHLGISNSDEHTCSKAMRSSLLNNQIYWVLIEKCEAVISIYKGSTSPPISRTQFRLTLAWASAVHKAQVLSLGQDVIDFDFRKQKSFRQGQIHTVLSRATVPDNLYCIGEFKKSATKVNKNA